MKTVPIRYLIDSKECRLLESLAKLDFDDDGLDENFFEEFIFRKLFRKMDEYNNNSFFMKNKYLYYLSDGAIAYLEAIGSMRKDLNNSDKIEIDEVVRIVKEKIKDYKEYDFVSLGCGDGEKDFKIISKLNDGYNPTYIPIDVSPQLLQLTINYFTDKNINKNTFYDPSKIYAINCDFFDFSDTLKADLLEIGNRKPKIYTCLGGTIGNYREEALLNKFSQIMDKDDYLVISFDLYNSDFKFENYIKKYLTHANIEFLINPLKLIPKFKGYLENRTRYFKFYPEEGEPPIRISDIDEGLSFAPNFIIPYDRVKKIYVAWTTKYLYKKIHDFFENRSQFEFEDGRVEGNKYFVLLKKKEISDNKRKAIERLKDLRRTEAGESNKIDEIINYIEKTNPEPIELIEKAISCAYSVIKQYFEIHISKSLSKGG